MGRRTPTSRCVPPSSRTARPASAGAHQRRSRATAATARARIRGEAFAQPSAVEPRRARRQRARPSPATARVAAPAGVSSERCADHGRASPGRAPPHRGGHSASTDTIAGRSPPAPTRQPSGRHAGRDPMTAASPCDAGTGARHDRQDLAATADHDRPQAIEQARDRRRAVRWRARRPVPGDAHRPRPRRRSDVDGRYRARRRHADAVRVGRWLGRHPRLTTVRHGRVELTAPTSAGLSARVIAPTSCCGGARSFAGPADYTGQLGGSERCSPTTGISGSRRSNDSASPRR